MIAGQLALVSAAVFAGAAIYARVAEHPARLNLDDRSLLAERKLAYQRGAAMQASFAAVGFVLGIWTWWQTEDWQWLVGALILSADWPYILLEMMPGNERPTEPDPTTAASETRRFILRRRHLHAVRSALGIAATAMFLWASAE